MASNTKNAQVESLVAEVAQIAEESKTEAVRKALQERRGRLQMLLQNEIWPQIPTAQMGVHLTKEEEEALLT